MTVKVECLKLNELKLVLMDSLNPKILIGSASVLFQKRKRKVLEHAHCAVKGSS
jgi:hypothetical protein